MASYDDGSAVYLRAFGGGTLNLFPTENRMSPLARAMLSSDAVHRYPGSAGPDFYFGDPDSLSEIYERCARNAREYFGARHALVPFLSGLHTMHAVVSSLTSPGELVLTMDPSEGGHYATEGICRGYGLDVGFVPFDRRESLVDCDALAALVRRRRPSMVYLDVSTATRIPRVADIRAAIGDDVLLCFDASHLLGLLPAALERAGLGAGLDTLSGSTHKTFPGPQKGVFLTDRADVLDRVTTRAGLVVSSGHSNSVAALSVTLEELAPFKVAYAEAIVANARALAGELAARGLDVPGAAFGHTETHQVWVLPTGDDPLAWGRALAEAGVRSTTVKLPATGTPGLRLGAQELTRVGMAPADMADVADVVVAAIREPAPSVRDRVRDLVARFPDVHWVAELDVARELGLVPPRVPVGEPS